VTIAEVNVNLFLAFPQGWTKADVEDHINDLLTKAAEDRDHNVVEFEVVDTRVNADPFGKEFQSKVTANFPQTPALFMGGPKLVSSLR
jgi:hypothetical protein